MLVLQLTANADRVRRLQLSMRGWRLATSLHPPLTGEGAALRGGRWNSIGVSVVYASTHSSLAPRHSDETLH